MIIVCLVKVLLSHFPTLLTDSQVNSILVHFILSCSLFYLTASASSVVGPAAASTISVAHNMVGKPTLVATEASLIQKEAHFRGEIDVTVSKIQLLLDYLEVVTQGHVKALNDLHIAGPSA
jgi:hypothetical protein